MAVHCTMFAIASAVSGTSDPSARVAHDAILPIDQIKQRRALRKRGRSVGHNAIYFGLRSIKKSNLQGLSRMKEGSASAVAQLLGGNIRRCVWGEFMGANGDPCYYNGQQYSQGTHLCFNGHVQYCFAGSWSEWNATCLQSNGSVLDPADLQVDERTDEQKSST